MTAIETGQRSIMDLLTKLTTGAGLPAGNPAAGIPPQAAAAAAAPGTYFCCVFPFFLNVSHHSTFSHLIANVLCVTEALMPTHRLPSFSPTMPKSFGLLLREWISRDLGSFKTYKFPAANQSLAQAYNKRKYLYNKIVSSKTAGQTLVDSAVVLDRQRVDLGCTLAKFHKHLHAEDGGLIRRTKKRRADADATPERRPLPAPRAPPRIIVPAAAARGRGPNRTTSTRGRGRNNNRRPQPAQQRNMFYPPSENPFPIGWAAGGNNGYTSNGRFGREN
jgi:hypothetical protein